MNKRRILAIAMSLVIVAILAIGATMAYFTADDRATNVFTYGDVDIKLNEDYEQNSKLLPVTGSAQNGTLINGVEKRVRVENTGSEDAFVRVHIAIPQILDNGDPSFDAKQNVLHFNYEDTSIGEGKWDWSKTAGAPYQGDWNYYETTIDDIKYNVYVVTYGTALKSGEETKEDAMWQVYLDKKVTQDDMKKIAEVLGENPKIYVVAEGAQASGFADAYVALNTSFGVPGTYTVTFE